MPSSTALGKTFPGKKPIPTCMMISACFPNIAGVLPASKKRYTHCQTILAFTALVSYPRDQFTKLSQFFED